MNQFFSFYRFNRLVLKHWADNKQPYKLSVLAFIGLLIAWFLFTMFIPDERLMHEDLQQSTFFFSFFVIGPFYASQYFNDLGSRVKGSNFLLVPASTFEKFLCSVLYTVLLFFVVFTTAFYLVDILMVSIANTFSANEAVGKSNVINIFTAVFFRFNSNSTLNFLLFFFSVQSAFLLGSVSYKEYSFIKTILSCFIVWLIVVLVLYFLHEQLVLVDERSSRMPDRIALVIIFLAYAIAPSLWIATYHRLKQKQL
jgi:hypothetical protein